jgi:hypothetical protein
VDGRDVLGFARFRVVEPRRIAVSDALDEILNDVVVKVGNSEEPSGERQGLDRRTHGVHGEIGPLPGWRFPLYGPSRTIVPCESKALTVIVLADQFEAG